MTERTLERLHDISELQSLKALYCEIVDSCIDAAAAAAARFALVFTEDATADYGNGMLVGRDAIIRFLVEGIGSTSDCIWHAIHSPRIDIEGDVGVGRWTVMARKQAKGAAAVDTVIGRYRDEFRRTPAGWRISAVRFEGRVG